MAKRKSLGRGLDALLSSTVAERTTSATDTLQDIPVDLLQRGRYQPRSDMREETIADLAESIRAQGLVQPIVVRPLAKHGGEAHYEIVAGERRWRAAQLAGLHSIPAIVRDIPDEAAVAMALIENIQREDLNALEEARALRQLVEEFGMTHAQAAEAVGRSRVAVSNLLRLLDLPAQIQAMLERRDFGMGHARALLALDGIEAQMDIARRILKEGWSVRETERAIQRLPKSRKQKATRKPSGARDPDVLRLETALADRLGARVRIEHKGPGGRIVVAYNTLEELDGILDHIES
ncbi:MAG: ParB/RepB/Spo0J family partition protein [Gammaproteobacteria bacterium]|nr:ParB/RepB/Spo0J family partition protein [Gammaproteobacteria bacterium]MDH3507306.1 ParB/RepB/Spo0J family partition protein [Gammaproteobacteria bacterium]